MNKKENVQKKNIDNKNNNKIISKIFITTISVALIIIISFFLLKLFDEEVSKYNITFESNGGSSVEAFAIEENNTIIKPEDPIKENYEFIGWYYNDELYDFSKPVTTDLKLEAKWEEIKKEEVSTQDIVEKNETKVEITSSYKVTFIDDDGTSLANMQKIKYGNKVTQPEEPIKQGHIFQGWYNGDAEYTFTEGVKANLVLKAKWTKNMYTIIFQNDDGSILEIKKVEYGTIPTCAEPTSTNKPNEQYSYIFAGWSPNVTPANQYTTYTATYTKVLNEYEVAFKDEDGTTLVSPQKVEYGSKATLPEVPEKDGHTFKGWYNGDVKYTFTEEVIGNVELTAKWEKNKYEVTFVNYDGTILETQTLEYGTIPTYTGIMPIKVADNTYTYSFDGWDKELVEITDNVTYTAKFSGTYIDYIIKFVDEDGTELSQKTYHYGDSIEEPIAPNKPSNAQYTYTFAGWTPGLTTVEKDEIYTATYTAILNKYEVIFKDEDGTILSETQTIEYGSKAIKPTEPSKKGHTFKGWYNGETEYTFVEEIKGNVELTAKWEKNKYTVIFVNYDNLIIETKTVEYGEIPTYTLPTKPANEQYTYIFAGWTPNLAPVEENTTYTAIYIAEINKYEVTFKDEDGTILSNAQKVEYGNKATEPETPNKDGYTFQGWYNGDAKYTFAEEVKGNVELTAKWEKNKYEVTFANYDGTILETQITEHGIVPVYTGTTPTKVADNTYTYSFNGWDKEVVEATSNVTYTAIYTSTFIDYVIKFIDEDGIEISQKTYHFGDTVEQPTNPTKSTNEQYTYTFAGWDPSVTTVEKDITYTATYTATLNKYEVTFKNEDGTILSDGQTVEYGNVATEPEKPIKEGHTFKGWYNGDAEYTFTEEVKGNVELIAKWEKNKYTVTFVNEDGTTLETHVLEYDAIPTYRGATPTKAADEQYTYTFVGWNPSIKRVKNDITYTAKYTTKTNTYEITFKDEDGTILANSQKVEYGSKAIEPEKPTREGYTFKGWYNGNTEYKFTEQVKGNVELVARWEKSKYIITFANYDGTILETQTVEHGAMPTYTGTTPVKQADEQYTYTFIGWEPSIEIALNNATYTALYTSTIRSYEVTFKDEDGTTLANTQTVEYGSKVTKPTEPVKVGHTFLGWYNGNVEYTFTEEVKGNVELTAKWLKIKYTITFVNYDGTILETKTVEYGTIPMYTGKTPTKSSDDTYSYKFVGWAPSIKAVEEDAIYTANFESCIDVDKKVETVISSVTYERFNITKTEDMLNVKFAKPDKLINMFYEIVKLFDVLSCDSMYEEFELYYKHGESKAQTIDLTKYNLKDTTASSWFGNGPNDRVGDWLGYLASGTASTSAAFNTHTDDLIGKTVRVTIRLKDGYILENGSNSIEYKITFSY